MLSQTRTHTLSLSFSSDLIVPITHTIVSVGCVAVPLCVSCTAAAQQRKRGLVVSAAELAPEGARADAASGNVDPRLRANRWFSQPLFDDVLADADAAAIQKSKGKKAAATAARKRAADSDDSDDDDDGNAFLFVLVEDSCAWLS